MTTHLFQSEKQLRVTIIIKNEGYINTNQHQLSSKFYIHLLCIRIHKGVHAIHP